MKQHNDLNTGRRNLLKAGLAAPMVLAGAGRAYADLSAPKLDPTTDSLTLTHPPKFGGAILPTRKLGRTGANIPIMAVGGAAQEHSLAYLEAAYDRGVRYFDTGEFYNNIPRNKQSEQNLAEFFAKYPERRKEMFVTTKKMFMKKQPEILLDDIDLRLKTVGVKQLDLLLMHAMLTEPDAYGEESLQWPKLDRVKEIARKLKESGKIRFFGFSTHSTRKAEYLEAAAEGGWIDAILVAYNPLTDRNPESRFCKALDACHQAGIGLIAMKTIQPLAKTLPPRLPEFEAMGMNTYQGIIHATLSDPRFSCVCSQMENADQMDQNTEAARNFKEPLKPELIDRLREVAMAAGPSMCPSCDGSCAHAAGTQLALADIARFVTYYECNGNMHARALYHELPELSRVPQAGIDLDAARAACPNNLDFAAILKRAECYFG